jgi:bifunctional non-homologous end joining protein LigD
VRTSAGRTHSWIKVKVRHEGGFVIVGLDVAVAGSCSLLLAAREGRRLVYVGRCEWGVSRKAVAALREQSIELKDAPCDGIERQRGVVWLEPRVVVDVQYNELMQRRLRDAVLRGFRSVQT